MWFGRLHSNAYELVQETVAGLIFDLLQENDARVLLTKQCVAIRLYQRNNRLNEIDKKPRDHTCWPLLSTRIWKISKVNKLAFKLNRKLKVFKTSKTSSCQSEWDLRTLVAEYRPCSGLSDPPLGPFQSESACCAFKLNKPLSMHFGSLSAVQNLEVPALSLEREFARGRSLILAKEQTK